MLSRLPRFPPSRSPDGGHKMTNSTGEVMGSPLPVSIAGVCYGASRLRLGKRDEAPAASSMGARSLICEAR